MKKIIINADDFGLSIETNEAIRKGIKSNIINSCSIITNTNAFENAVVEILPEISNINLGFHFNIMEGKSLSCVPLLCDLEQNFNNNFLQILQKSNNKAFLNQVEQEFRVQIERILQYHKITHIDSHIHIHAIPTIFDLFIKLAKEYNIEYIRTQKEIPYLVCNKIFNLKLPINILKNCLLNYFSYINIPKIKENKLKTNDYFVGVMYTGNMDKFTILNGLKQINEENSLTEVLIHPYFSELPLKEKLNNYNEFLITQDVNIRKNIENMGFYFFNE
jgi:predicted glycoside hydrolase/deacetylase ChbG (UPF0249 family)